MKTNQLFEKLWEHSRTLRRVGLVLVMCLLTITQAWAWIEISSANVYYDNSSSNWDESKNVVIAIERLENWANTDNHGCGVFAMGRIANTKLWRWAGSFGYNDINGYRFGSGAKTYDWYAWWYDNGQGETTSYGLAGRDNWANVSGFYQESMGNVTKIFGAISSARAANLSKKDISTFPGDMNYTQNVYYSVCEGAGGYSKLTSGTTPAKIHITSYKFVSGTYDAVSSETPDDIAAGGTTRTRSFTAGHTATTQITVSNIVDGYEFMGWYDAASGGTQLEDAEHLTYTYYPKSACDVYARFRKTTYSLAGENWNTAGINWAAGTVASGGTRLMTTTDGITYSTTVTGENLVGSTRLFKLIKNQAWDANAISANSSVTKICYNGTLGDDGTSNHNFTLAPYLAGAITVSYNTSTTTLTVTCEEPIITFSKDGGDGGTSSQKTYSTKVTSSVEKPSKTGYKFDGYWSDDDTPVQVIDKDGNWKRNISGYTDNSDPCKWSASLNSNHTFTAHWTAKTYNLTLNQGNGTGASGKVTMTYNSSSHASITAPTPPTGYSFVGWYTGSGGTGSMVMNASGVLQVNVDGYTGAGGIWTKDGSCTLYAKYTANYPDGYIYITDVMATPVSPATSLTLSSASFYIGTGGIGSTFQTNRSGYEYWARISGSSSSATLTFSSGLDLSSYSDGVDIYVWWGSDGNHTTSISVNGGDVVAIDNIPSSDERNLVREATYHTGVSSLSSIVLKGSNAGVTWFRIGIKETEAPSCTTPSSASITGKTEYIVGETIELTASATGTDEATTYEWFKGDPTDGGVSQGDASTSGATFTKISCAIEDAATYYCVISNGGDCETTVSQAITVAYQVTYAANGGTGDAMANSTGTSITLSANSYTAPSGYTFDGWRTVSDKQASGTDYAAGTSSITANLDLYAMWKQTVTLDDDGGSNDGSAVVYYNASSASTPTAPTYSGYTADGYYAEPGCTNLVMSTAGALTNCTGYVSGGKWVHSGATTLYAHYKCTAPTISCTDNVVTMSTTSTGATIYYTYTTDGSTPSDPTSSDNEYDSENKPVITKDTQFKAIAIESGKTSSAVTSQSCTYTAFSSSVNIEQAVLTNGTSWGYASALTSANIDYDLTPGDGESVSLDNLNYDCSKTDMNNNYRGLKIKSSGKYIQVNLAKGKTLKVRFGYRGSAVNLWIGGVAQTDIPTSGTYYTYELEKDDDNNRVVKIGTQDAKAVVIKQIMIGEDIAPVDLPAQINIADGITNGTISASSTANVGSDVTVTVTPSTGYELATLTYQACTGDPQNINLVSKQFEMPNSKVTLNATFVLSCSAPAAPTISGTTTYTTGETMTLRATCASGADESTTYTWYKGATYGSASQVQAAATGSAGYTLTKTFAVADAGTYWCKASNGTGCDANNSVGYVITAQTYTVTYEYNGATGGSSTGSTTAAQVTLPTPTKTSNTFDGWYVGATKIGNGGGTYYPTADVTAYAKWKENCAGGGDPIVWDFTSNDFINSGSWSTSSGTTNSAYATDGETVLSYVAGGSSDEWDSSNKQLKTHGTTSTSSGASKKQLTNKYFIFPTLSGNATISVTYGTKNSTLTIYEATSTNIYGLDPIITLTSSSTTSDTYNFSSSKTYYMTMETAKVYFKNITVTPSGSCFYVTYNGNGADGGFTNDPTAYSSSRNTVTVEENGFTKTDHVFVGWNTKSDGSGAWKHKDNTFTITQDTILYAQWKEINYFTNGASTGNWNNNGNWSLGSLPTIDDPVVIQHDVIVDINNAKALLVDIEAGNTLTINAGKALIIDSILTKAGGATAAADVIINSDRTTLGVGALIIGEETGLNKATVNFQTKVKRESGTGNWINQFIGSPFSDLEPYVDYALQIYKFCADNSGNRGYWHKLSSGDEMVEFYGYNVLYNDNNFLEVNWTGTLNESDEVTVTGTNYQTDNLFANSWVAPIHIAAFEEGDFTNFDPTIYIFNAGTPQQEGSMSSTGTATDPGTYVTIPINSGEWLTGTLSVIPAMQAFFVKATGASPSIKLDYSKLVYTPALTSVDITPTRAPRRSAEVAPEVIRLHVAGENGWAENTYVLGREDFTEGYDRGWDGRYMEGEDTNPQLYTPTTDGYMAVNCVPEIEGTVVGFRKGSSDNNYIFSFDYDGDEVWYLNDQKAQKSTQIMNGQTYAFVSEAGDNAARFVISATPINKIATGCESVGAEAAKVRKVIIDDKVYIIRGGQVFDVLGKTIKK